MKVLSKVVSTLLLLGVVGIASAQKVSKVSLSTGSVLGGAPVTGTVEISTKAGKTGAVVTLASPGPQATVPPTITISAGQTSGTFAVATLAVAVDTRLALKATVGTSSATANLTVQAPRIAEFAFSPASVQGGSITTGVIKLTSVSPTGGIKVTLSSNTPFWGGPSSFVVPAGSNTGTFPVTTIPVVGTTDANVAAQLSGSRAVASINLTPALFTTFRITPTSLVGGTAAVGSLTLNGPAPKEGFRVKVLSESPLTKVPTYVVIPSGGTTITFPISTTAVATTKVVRIIAGGSGAWIELALELNPPQKTN